MARLGELISPTERGELYGVKGEAKNRPDVLLTEDPRDMNRSRFKLYMAAKVEALVQEARQEGVKDPSVIADLVDKTMGDEIHRWRARAAEINRNRTQHAKHVRNLKTQ